LEVKGGRYMPGRSSWKYPTYLVEVWVEAPDGKEPDSAKLKGAKGARVVYASRIEKNGEAYKIFFQVGKTRLEQLRGNIVEFSLGFSERRKGYVLRRWVPVTPSKLIVHGEDLNSPLKSTLR